MLRLLIEEELDWDGGDVQFWMAEKREEEGGEDVEGEGMRRRAREGSNRTPGKG